MVRIDPNFTSRDITPDNRHRRVLTMEATYSIIRHFAPSLEKENEVIDTGLTLEEAQEHCNDPDTREDGEWFDGYTEE